MIPQTHFYRVTLVLRSCEEDKRMIEKQIERILSEEYRQDCASVTRIEEVSYDN